MESATFMFPQFQFLSVFTLKGMAQSIAFTLVEYILPVNTYTRLFAPVFFSVVYKSPNFENSVMTTHPVGFTAPSLASYTGDPWS
jgi:hypothetical protein